MIKMSKRNIAIALGAVGLLAAACAEVSNRAHDTAYGLYVPAACDAQRAERARAFRDGLLERVPAEHLSAVAPLVAHLEDLAAGYDAGTITPERRAVLNIQTDSEIAATAKELHRRGVITVEVSGPVDAVRTGAQLIESIGVRKDELEARVGAVVCDTTRLPG